MRWDFTIVFMANFITKSREISIVDPRLFDFEDNESWDELQLSKMSPKMEHLWKVCAADTFKNNSEVIK